MISTASEVLPALLRNVILFSGVARSSHSRPHGGITFLICSRFQGLEPTSSPLPISKRLFALDTFAPHKENLPIRTFVHVTVELFTTKGFYPRAGKCHPSRFLVSPQKKLPAPAHVARHPLSTTCRKKVENGSYRLCPTVGIFTLSLRTNPILPSWEKQGMSASPRSKPSKIG